MKVRTQLTNNENRKRTNIKLQSISAVVFALMLVVASSGYAQQKAGVLFQSGLYQEQVKGDIDAAIKIYERIIINFPRNRPVAAKALLHIGLCFEKLGKQEAQKAYQRLIKEYTDQPEPVRIAHQHLQQLDAGAPGAKANGPTYSLVLDDQMAGMRVGQRDFSPSGDRIVFGSRDKLYITDLAGTVIRPILDDMGPWEYPRSLQWSPDGRLISYWARATREVTSDSSKDPVWAIFVISPDGGAPRQIGPKRPWATFIFKIDWTPDGKNIFYLHEDGLHMLSLDGSEVRFIPKKDFSGKYPSRYSRKFSTCEYSPNGRWLMYLAISKATERREWDIWILPATGGQAQRLTNLSGKRPTARWAPDGRAVYFDNSENIWKISFDPETGLAKGQSQQVTFFNDTRVSISRVLGDGDRIAFQMSKSNTSIQVADASSLNESRALVPGDKPQPSPDGKTIYYLHGKRGEEGIFAVPREGGAPRRLTTSRPEANARPISKLKLSPDGRTLAYITKVAEGEGLVTLPVSGGEPHLLVKMTNARWVEPQWSPDGSQLAYADGNDLYVIPAAGGKPRELAHPEHGWEQWTVRWSPDGKFIAALGRDNDLKESSNAVFVVPASGGKPRQLTPDVEYKEGLEWHPDGKRLTYHVSLYHSETRQVYLDGRPPTLLVDAPDVWDYTGIWAPDGRRFIFSGSVQGDWGVYAYDEASGKTTLVSDPVRNAGLPRWSRDGKTAAWGASNTTAVQSWIMENFLPESKAGE